MNVLDIALGSLLLLGLVRGLMKGLFVEIASLAALVVGIYGAIHFSDYAAAFLENKTSWDEKYINITAFAITFVVLVLAIAMAGKALTKIANFAALGIRQDTDKLEQLPSEVIDGECVSPEPEEVPDE